MYLTLNIDVFPNKYTFYLFCDILKHGGNTMFLLYFILLLVFATVNAGCKTNITHSPLAPKGAYNF